MNILKNGMYKKIWIYKKEKLDYLVFFVIPIIADISTLVSRIIPNIDPIYIWYIMQEALVGIPKYVR